MGTTDEALSIASEILKPAIEAIKTALGALQKIQDDLEKRQTIDTSATDETEKKYGDPDASDR